jgi:hypothetical protein
MSQSKRPDPKYRHHHESGQAFVQIKGKRHYLGVHGTKEHVGASQRDTGRRRATPIAKQQSFDDTNRRYGLPRPSACN